ncbi:MAG: energy-coupling factor transporter ATPase [Clostridia bacterium]|nr:energy-coupling factor transporter ATPase [Clostridia bacterium]
MAVLEVKNISFGYSHGTPFEITALKNVSFSLEKGELVGVIGHTGSGKSTLMQMLNSLLKPESGEILLDGKNINADKKSVKEARHKVGLCFQYPEYQLFEETCFKDISFGPKNMGLSEEEIRQRVYTAAEIVGLQKELLDKSPFDLSGGQKRRCAIAGVIAMLPEVLILDEPTAGLDPVGRAGVLEMIDNYRRQTGATVIIVTHSMDIVASIADRILVMNKGELAFNGSVSDIFTHSDELVRMGLDVPVATKIMLALRNKGLEISSDIYTLEDAAKELCFFLAKEGKI